MSALPLFDAASTVARDACLRIIRSRTGSNPASIAYLQGRTGLSPRAIKAVVEDARVAGEAICASRGKLHGYYLAGSAEEIESSAVTLCNQARRMLLAASKLAGKHRLREFLGQLAIEVDGQ